MHPFYLTAIIVAVVVGTHQAKRYHRNYKLRMIKECREGHMAIGKKIFHTWNASDLEKCVGEIREWERTYTGKVEQGLLNKLHDQLQAEWHTRYHLVKPNQKSA